MEEKGFERRVRFGGVYDMLFATGHYRNGILMTPITVRFIRQMLIEGKTPDGARPFLPGRLNS